MREGVDAADGTAAVATEPDGAPRVAMLDILRGVAILGILFMNVPSMGAPIAAAHSPLPDLIGWTPADRVAFFLQKLLASGTARALLEMLFGAGMVILTGRLAEGRTGWSAARRYYWRNAVLFAFGIVHVLVLLWPGDILHIYALSAMIVFPLRRLRARWLIVLGLSFAIYSTAMSGMSLSNAIRENRMVAEAQAARAAGRPITAAQKKGIEGLESWHKQVAKMRAAAPAEAKLRRSGYAGWAKALRADWWKRYGNWRTPLNMYWEAAAAMLMGAALFRLGILQGRRSPLFYARLAVAAYAVGLGVRAIDVTVLMRIDDTVTIAWALDEWTRLATAIGHLSLIGWMWTSGRGAALLRPFAAAGRTALSLYILQTILCLWVIYPPFALGAFGHQGWAALMLTALAIDAALLLLANWWVARFPIAPVEWAWRSIVAGRRLPFRGRAHGAGGAGTPLPA